MKRVAISAVTVITAGALLCWGGWIQVATAGPRPAGQAGHGRASGVDLAGTTLDALEKSQGKPLVLIYVRTDCPISNRYAPTIEALGKKYAGRAVFMLVYPDKTETTQAIEKHINAYGYAFTPVRDPQHELVTLGKVNITPEVAVFNAQRELIYHGRIDNWYKDFGRARPAPTTHELDEALQAALDGRSAPASVGGVGCYISDLQ